MDQRRLEPVGKRTQFLGCAMASGTAHDDDVVGLVDAARHVGNICVAGGDFRARLERGDTRNAAVDLCHEDIDWQRQMRDAAAGIGFGNCLMDDGRCLCRRGNGLIIKGDVTEQQVGICGLKIVDTLQLARHISGERKNRRVVATCLIEAGDKVGAAGSG